MANSINATSTSNGGLVTTGDDSGVLNIQTNETTAISIDASQNATFTNGANLPNTFGFKNRIINGAMMIDQRGSASSPITATSSDRYSVDRFVSYIGSGSGVFTAQQSSTAPSGFVNSMKTTVTTTDSSLAASDNYQLFIQYIEGLNTADFGWGAAGAATVTVSFWARSSVTGTYPVSIRNSGASRSYVTTFTISAADTWEYKTMTIAGDTSGTWLTTNGMGVNLNVASVAGSDKQAASLNTWLAGNYTSHSSCTNWVASSGATFYITGVQLEKGTQATSFDFRSYGTELALCQRYAFVSVGGSSIAGAAPSSTVVQQRFVYPVSMRSAPTASVSTAGSWGITDDYFSGHTAASFGLGASGFTTEMASVNITGFSGLTTGRSYFGAATGTGKILFSAEL